MHENARREVLQEAADHDGIRRSAVRDYTDRRNRAAAGRRKSRSRFLPQTIPFFAAKTNLRALAKQFPDYTYKEAALNPTNPADRPPIGKRHHRQFSQSPSLTNLTSTRDTPAGPILSISRPIRITDKSCLACHSTPAAAPQSMVDLYGSANGFGWKLGDVVGAQIVSVPMSVALGPRRRGTFKVYLGGLAAVFLVTLLLLNLLLHFVDREADPDDVGASPARSAWAT